MNRLSWYRCALYALPVLVAWLGLGVAAALALVATFLVLRWGLTLATLMTPQQGPELTLETISASHFVEKVRWCLDRLDLPYHEQHNAGVIGAFFAGRTVPKLHIRTGIVVSSIGNSPEILRYLWGRYSTELGPRAEFLKPDAERLALEKRLDAYGVHLQQWIYSHILPNPAFTLHAWGGSDPTLPAWQRWSIRLLYPLLRVLMIRSFRLGPDTLARCTGSIEKCLIEIEQSLGDGRKTLLGGREPDFTDITLAALSGLWTQPDAYGGGRAAAVRPLAEDTPSGMAADMARWRRQFPLVAAHCDRLYAQERRSAQPSVNAD